MHKLKQEDEGTFTDCLRDAVDATNEALTLLDLQSRRCPTCGATRFTTYPDRLTANALGAVLIKLQGELAKTVEQNAER